MQWNSNHRRKRRGAAGFVNLLACAAAFALVAADKPERPQTNQGAKKILDVPYNTSPSADPLHKLDLYLPREKQNFPVVIYIHGGGWNEGDKQDHHALPCVALTEDGFGLVSLNYRLTPQVLPPTNIEDCARAVAWAVTHIAEYGGDPDQLFLAGHSAGGHLAAMLALDPVYLKTVGVSHRQFRGVIAISGVYRLPVPNPEPNQWYQARFGPVENWDRFSPLTHVSPEDPAFFMLYSEKDVKQQPQLLSAAFAKLGRTDKVLEIEDRDHTTIMHGIANADDPARRAIVEFIQRQTATRNGEN